jgi:hypothetical protein
MDLRVLPTVGFRLLYAFGPGPGSPAYPLSRGHIPSRRRMGCAADGRSPSLARDPANTCSATATPSMGTSSGIGSPRWVSAVGPLPPGALAKRIYRTPRRRDFAETALILKLYADNHNRMRVLAPPSRPREDLVPRRGTLGKNRFRR